MANALNDGMNKPNQLADGAVTASEHSIMATGSPSAVYGTSIRFGDGTLGTGSSIFVGFLPNFAGAPKVFVSHNDGTNTGIAVKNSNVSGATIEGVTASKPFNWLAIGSG